MAFPKILSPFKHPFGVVVDIDDTIADTSVACAQLLWEKYPITRFANPQLVLSEYGFIDKVEEWSSSPAQQLLATALQDPKFLMSLPPILKAQWGLAKISQKIPIACYLTSRLPFAEELTLQWLDTYGFPAAPLICRLDHVRDIDWKVQYVQKNLPKSFGLIDNELYVPADTTYQGKLIELVRFKKITPLHPNVLVYKQWPEMIREVFSL